MSLVMTYISKGLYDEIQLEKKKLMLKEKRKVKSRRKKITHYHASQSLVRKLRK